VLCQLTSNSYADSDAIQREDDDFANGLLSRISHARPGKVFTARQTLMASHVGKLEDDSLREVANTVIHPLQSNDQAHPPQ
jgi:mRNA interferase MazF